MQDLVEDILGCAQRSEDWEPTLNRITEQFGLYSAVIFTIHDFAAMRTGFYWSDRLRTGFSEEARARIERGEDVEDHEAYARVMRLPALVPADELSLMGVDSHADLPPSEIRDLCEQIGIKMRIPAVLNRSGPWVDGFFAHTRHENDHKAFIVDPDVRTMLAVVSNSITLGRVIQTLKSRYRAALTSLDRLGLGVFVLDSLGRVVERNREAQNILDQKDGLSISSAGRLLPADTNAAAELEQIIHAQSNLTEDNSDPKKSMMSVPRSSLAYDYLMSVRALRDVDGELSSGFHGLFVIAIDPARGNALSSDGLTALGGLTQVESETAQLLVNGLKIVDISAHRDVSVDTVRNQVKTIFQKLRCNSQSDVIRTAAVTRIPLVDEDR